jgi:hypothetical protein
MPYQSIVDLPSTVSEHLPIHAQEIFPAAFNNAFDQYAGRPDRESAVLPRRLGGGETKVGRLATNGSRSDGDASGVGSRAIN